MTWKDMLPVQTDKLKQDMMTKETRPDIRPIESSTACEISIVQADGVPLPKNEKFDRQAIVKRSIRVGLYDSYAKKYLANTAQVICSWTPDSEDVWKVKPGALNPIMFRTTDWEDLDKEQTWFLFELVVYVNQN
jgi:hypothetical protein